MSSARILLALSLLAGCAAPTARFPSWQAEPGLIYCYRTLADPDCYRQPLAGANHRLIATAPQVFFTPAGWPIAAPASALAAE